MKENFEFFNVRYSKLNKSESTRDGGNRLISQIPFVYDRSFEEWLRANFYTRQKLKTKHAIGLTRMIYKKRRGYEHWN